MTERSAGERWLICGYPMPLVLKTAGMLGQGNVLHLTDERSNRKTENFRLLMAHSSQI